MYTAFRAVAAPPSAFLEGDAYDGIGRHIDWRQGTVRLQSNGAHNLVLQAAAVTTVIRVDSLQQDSGRASVTAYSPQCGTNAARLAVVVCRGDHQVTIRLQRREDRQLRVLGAGFHQRSGLHPGEKLEASVQGTLLVYGDRRDRKWRIRAIIPGI